MRMQSERANKYLLEETLPACVALGLALGTQGKGDKCSPRLRLDNPAAGQP
jgi:hypothetical protein